MTSPKLKLLSRYLNCRCTPTEKRKVEDWISSSPDNKNFFDRLKKVWDLSGHADANLDYSRPIRELVAMMQQSDCTTGDGNFKVFRMPARPVARWILFRAVVRYAAVMVALIGALYVVQAIKEMAIEKQALKRSSAVISRQASTQQGEQMTLDLSYGVKIVLNSASDLRYVERPDGSRDVYLKGEAYFDVVHSTSRTFTVHVNDETIRDVGTRFNVRAWPDDKNMWVSVMDGSVSIQRDLSVGTDVVVSRNQYCILNGAGIVVPPTYTDVSRDIDWMEGKLVFHNASMGEVAKQLYWNYGIRCLVADTSILSRRITTAFDKQDPPKRIISIIALTLNLSCEVSGDSVLFVDSKTAHPGRALPGQPYEKQ